MTAATEITNTNGSSHRSGTIVLQRSLFHSAAAIVKREYGRDLTLDYIAQQLTSSRRQLQRAFAEVGGTTFRQYLIDVRLDKAALLLRSGRPLGIGQIARHVGYQQQAHFAKSFRRRHGLNPSEYRRRYLLEQNTHFQATAAATEASRAQL